MRNVKLFQLKYSALLHQWRIKLDSITDLSEEEFTEVVDFVVEEISEEITVKFSGFEEIYTARVMKDDLLDGDTFPTTIDRNTVT